MVGLGQRRARRRLVGSKAGFKAPAPRLPAAIAVLWCAALVCVGLAALVVQTGQAAVTLVYFRAEPGQNQVRLSWETATELNNSGFYVLRSLQQNGTYERISTFIFAQGDPVLGAVYEYTDSGLQNLVEYWYRLEAIDTSQNSEFTDAIPAVPGATPTPPPTRTPTATATGGTTAARTFTPTATSGTPGSVTPASPTPTATPSPTQVIDAPTGTFAPTNTFVVVPSATVPAPATATQPPPTPTGNPMLTPQALPPGAPTPTLLPLPEVTVVFSTPAPTGALAANPVATGALEKQAPGLNSSRLARLWPFGALLALWGVLGGWFYFTARKIE